MQRKWMDKYYEERGLDTTSAAIPLIQMWALASHSDIVFDKLKELYDSPGRRDDSNHVKINEEEYNIVHRLCQEESEQKRYTKQLRRYEREAASSASEKRLDVKT